MAEAYAVLERSEAVTGSAEETRHCVSCGSAENRFRSPRAVRCVECDEPNGRQTYTREYHAARAKALSRLVAVYHDVYEVFLMEERTKILARRKRGGPED